MSTTMTPEQRQAKRDRDARYRKNKKDKAAASGQAVTVTAPVVPEAPAVEPTPVAPIQASTGPSPLLASAERMRRLMENSVSFLLSFKRLQTKRSVGSDAVDVDADKSMVHVGKDILDSDELRAIVSYDNSTAMWFRNRCTTPRMFRGFLLPASLLADAFEWMAQRTEGRDALIEKFKAAYPAKKVDAQKRLKDLYNPTDYPSLEAVAKAFAMEYVVTDLPTVSRKVGSVISEAAMAKERAKAEAQMADVTQGYDQMLAALFQEQTAALLDALGAADTEGKPKRIHPAKLANLENLLADFPRRNVTGNEYLNELAGKMRDALKGVDTATLKSTADVRNALTSATTEIKAALDAALVDAPKRAINLGDEEV